jgi:hypothetical protein
MKFVRLLGWVLLTVLGLLLVLAAVSLAPVDRTPYTETDAYRQTQAAFQRLKQTTPPVAPGQPLRAGWARVNLTPPQPGPTGGYGVRRGADYTSVHDSVFVRALVFDNGLTRAALVSADLLIIPPTVTARLRAVLPTIGFTLDRTYLGATHTHNSIGGWGEKLGGEVMAGDFDPKQVDFIVERIVRAIDAAQKQLSPIRLGFDQVYQADMVRNRIWGNAGTLDPFIRLLKLENAAGQTALLCTYAAHATLLEDRNLALSRDYPGALVDSLERQSVDFALFQAGAVGSMGPLSEGKDDWERVRNEALGLQLEIQRVLPQIKTRPDSTLAIVSLPLALRESQFRISEDWRLRPWVWSWLFGEASAELKALRVGEVLFLGLPCDYSGELVAEYERFARQRGLRLVITSFNGGYIGYITPDGNYDRYSYETRDMNWFGPGNAGYLGEFMRKLITLLS